LGAQAPRQFEQVVGVHTGVLALVLGQRPLPPVAALQALVELDVEVLGQSSGQADAAPAERHRRHLRVEHAGELELVRPLEGEDVVLGVVEHLDDPRLGEDRHQRRQVGDRQRIDQDVAVGAADLDQTQALAVGEQRVRLGVHRDRALPEQPARQLTQRLVGIDVGRGDRGFAGNGHAVALWGPWRTATSDRRENACRRPVLARHEPRP
jgi:hypothetical protein